MVMETVVPLPWGRSCAMISTTVSEPRSPPPAELLQELIRFDTSNPPGNEAQCIAYIERLLRGSGLETRTLARSDGRPNLIARLPGAGDAAPLLLQGHVDVVAADASAWTHPPFGGVVEDGCVWGRGALDMKGGVAMMIWALLEASAWEARPAGDVIFVALSDEEGGGRDGAEFLVSEHHDLFDGVRYAIGEFGGFSIDLAGRRLYLIQVAEKRACWLRLRIRGDPGHASMPRPGGTMGELGSLLSELDRVKLPTHITPAAEAMVEGLAASLPMPLKVAVRGLKNERMAGAILKLFGDRGARLDAALRNTITPTLVRAGDKINVIPSEAELSVDARLVPGWAPDEFLEELERALGRELEAEVIRFDGGPEQPDMGLFRTLGSVLEDADPGAHAVPFLMPASTDGRFFAKLGIQSYGFLPMPLGDLDFASLIHGVDERIPVEAVGFGARCMYDLLRRYGRN